MPAVKPGIYQSWTSSSKKAHQAHGQVHFSQEEDLLYQSENEKTREERGNEERE